MIAHPLIHTCNRSARGRPAVPSGDALAEPRVRACECRFPPVRRRHQQAQASTPRGLEREGRGGLGGEGTVEAGRDAHAVLSGRTASGRHRQTGETYPQGTPRGDASVPRRAGRRVTLRVRRRRAWPRADRLSSGTRRRPGQGAGAGPGGGRAGKSDTGAVPLPFRTWSRSMSTGEDTPHMRLGAH